jgi:hypothetical protein
MRPGDGLYQEDDRRHATSIFEAATWGYAVKVTCRCRQTGIFEPLGLWWRFKRKGWSDDFRDAVRCCYCRSCTKRTGRKVRPTRMETTSEPPRIRLPLPDEREWKRAVSRNRG